MPKLVRRIPAYRKHKATGQAVVTLDGRDRYLGRYGTAASKAAYKRLVAEHLAGQRLAAPDGSTATITELSVAYFRYADGYFSARFTHGTMGRIKTALRFLRDLYGPTLAAEFGPVRLKAVRQKMLAEKSPPLSRKYVNELIRVIRAAFKWGASEELVPGSVWHNLACVDGLRRGKSTAKESPPVLPVPDSIIEATLPWLSDIVADMVRLQRLAGMRPTEVCLLRPCDLDRSGAVWQYRPSMHKVEHHGQSRVVFIGPQGQEILLAYLLRDPEAFCFAPSQALERHNAERRENRESPMTPSQAARKPKRWSKWQAGDRYTNDSYRRAIHRACDRVTAAAKAFDPQAAGVKRWSPNRLRHTAATEIRARFGLEAAQVMLGHSKANTTEIYAERDMAKAAEVARQIG